ncbi:Mce-associated membrane protein [Rhodococcus erythropolis]|uniref:twin-arginine translocation pathway signal n=1 Tax=Rhodococcus erythropolis TaxID=1833 RepID=UPI0021696632|nr:twin-arginine translocation pathway signal [Rhodococcus erythropolis]MCS4257861.1 Mce-associated membrane protein [Rhodococcus erythropolis]MCW2425166.1 Mce-associated membrane protein [Rhodococcus erythropolis]
MKIEEVQPEALVVAETIEEGSDVVVDASSPAEDTVSPDRRPRWASARFALIVLLVASTFTAWAYLFFVTRPADSALVPARQQTAVDAAADAAVAILTYKSDTVDADLGAATSRVTGTFGDYYRTFTRDVVAPAAKEKQISTSATVVGKAISEFSADKAIVVVFLNQTTTTADVTEPTATSTTIRVEVERHGDNWLVSKFDPA